MEYRHTVAVLILLFVLSIPSFSQLPEQISFQGILSDANGTPKPDGTYTFTFRLYEVQTGGNALWSETKTLQVKDGLFATLLGDQTLFGSDVDFDKPYWVGIQVATDPELSPRLKLTGSAYSMRSLRADIAEQAESVVEGQVVRSINGLRDDVTINATGGATVSMDGNTITINAGSGGGGTGIQGIQNTNGTLDITNPSGPTATVNLKTGAVANAFLASDAASLNKVSAGAMTSTSGNIGIGTTNPQYKLHLVGNAKFETPNYFIAGHSSNTVSSGVVGATISGGGGSASTFNRITDNYGAVGGGVNNQAGDDAGSTADRMYATVGGGQVNSAKGVASTVAGGASNTASGNYSTVSGGISNTSSGHYSTTSGGSLNIASGTYSTVGGGYDSEAGGEYSTISGGVFNTSMGDYSTLGGGRNNKARGAYSVVAGGGGFSAADSNSATGAYSTVSGGNRNIAEGPYASVSGGLSNSASGPSSVVGGGSTNISSGSVAVVSGGALNVASGQYSAISGGWRNRAAGNYSFAAGNGSKALHSGSVVISASEGTGASDTLSTSGVEQMLLRADGGFYLTNASGIASIPAGHFLETKAGAYLTTGGVWTNSSDRNVKENFEAIDTKELLEHITKLPITRWNYKAESSDVKHIGPMAQDFYRLFGLGSDDKSISSIDPAGIALAAIQELYKKYQEIDDLQRRVARLESLLGSSSENSSGVSR